MPEPESQNEPTVEAAAPSRISALLSALPQTAIQHWRRSLAVGAAAVAILIAFVIAWTYTARFAIQHERERLVAALTALDAGDYDQARTLVRRVLNNVGLPRQEYGTPLFVLGAVKTFDAGNDIVPERRRTGYLVASRYLTEAHSYGWPTSREKQGLLLLGKSLVESYQVRDGIDVLSEGLAVEPQTGGPFNPAIHRLLAEAFAQLSPPKFDQALSHVSAALADEGLSSDQRTAAILLKAKILSRLARFDEAQQALATVPAETERQAAVSLARAHVALDGVEAALQRLPAQEQDKLPPDLLARIDEASALLKDAQSQDKQAGDITRRALYLLGRAAELRGDHDDALQMFRQTHQKYGDTPEGLAAELGEADIRRRGGDDKASLTWYRQVLVSGADPTNYRSDVLPIEQLRGRILEAVGDYVNKGLFDNATTLLESFPPLFTRTEQLELRGDTLKQWGDRQLVEADKDSEHDDELRRSGRRHMREAGVAYEKLAGVRFATEHYSDDIWNSADCFYRGQSYSNTARLLDVYLKNEPEKRNAQALLLLGQSDLALGNVDQCIAALEECIELYARDNATYEARIDCANAYRYRGNAQEAERLLRSNLTESNLKPSSPEWRDSLFALGRLLFSQGRNEDAIDTLEEAVERYPDDAQTLQTRYLIGESYRRWADEPLSRMQQARTASEREKGAQLVHERLAKALESFKEVQRAITLRVRDVQQDPLYGAMLRNCYMLEGTVLFDLERYEDAIKSYSNVSSLYPNEPFVIETFVQIADCWQRLDRVEKAHGAIQQAQLTLDRLPKDADFAATTAFSRDEWKSLLSDMSKW
ncbi:MAG TPA: tetratricopeptide repeat protein [Lacipirellulaceae bacterium]